MRFVLLLAIYSGIAQAQLGIPVFSGNCTGSQTVTLVPDSTNRYKVGLQLELAKMILFWISFLDLVQLLKQY